MDTASIKQLKDTLSTLGREELIGLLLRMVKFKKENKELLTFLLFESDDLDAYVYEISQEIKDEFENYRLYLCRNFLKPPGTAQNIIEHFYYSLKL